jgi:hypothetical protein
MNIIYLYMPKKVYNKHLIVKAYNNKKEIILQIIRSQFYLIFPQDQFTII